MYVSKLTFQNQAKKKILNALYRLKDNFIYFSNIGISLVRLYHTRRSNRKQQLGFLTKTHFRIISKRQ